MSLLDDARRIMHELDPSCQGQGRCILCYRLTESIPSAGLEAEPHVPDCPWLSRPKIIAALEAAERFVSLNRRDDVPIADLMRAEDDLHEAFGDARRYD